jgi:hypothetical protein
VLAGKHQESIEETGYERAAGSAEKLEEPRALTRETGYGWAVAAVGPEEADCMPDGLAAAAWLVPGIGHGHAAGNTRVAFQGRQQPLGASVGIEALAEERMPAALRVGCIHKATAVEPPVERRQKLHIAAHIADLLAGVHLELLAEARIDNPDSTEPGTELRHETRPKVLEQARLAPAEGCAGTHRAFPGRRTDTSDPACPGT